MRGGGGTAVVNEHAPIVSSAKSANNRKTEKSDGRQGLGAKKETTSSERRGIDRARWFSISVSCNAVTGRAATTLTETHQSNYPPGAFRSLSES